MWLFSFKKIYRHQFTISKTYDADPYSRINQTLVKISTLNSSISKLILLEKIKITGGKTNG
jgi:hypothetical protein